MSTQIKHDYSDSFCIGIEEFSLAQVEIGSVFMRFSGKHMKKSFPLSQNCLRAYSVDAYMLMKPCTYSLIHSSIEILALF